MREFLQRHPFLLRSIIRRAHQTINPLFFQTVHVNEFPKSGGTWLCRMLSEGLDWRFDDLEYPRPGKAVVKHHRLKFSLSPTVTIIRDPRDVAVSYYHHCRKVFHDNEFNSHIVSLMEKHVFHDCMTETEELDAFVKMLVTDPITPPFTWGDFYRSSDRVGTIWVRYEDLRSDPLAELGRLFSELELFIDDEHLLEVIKDNDIKNILANREKDGKAHFIRKGQVGGWKEVLSSRAVELIERDAGELLMKHGYA